MAQQGVQPGSTSTVSGNTGAIPLVGNNYTPSSDTTNVGAGNAFGSYLAQLNAFGQQNNNNYNLGAQNTLAQHLTGLANGVGTPEQQQYARMLQMQATGQGPSLAQAQLSAATNQNASLAASAAASARGLDPAMAARMALAGQQNANQQAAGQSALVRGQEQQTANTALGSQTNAVAGQGLQAAQLAGGIYQGIGSQNLGQQQTANTLYGNAANAQNSQDAIRAGVSNNNNNIGANTAAQNATFNQALLGSASNAAGAILPKVYDAWNNSGTGGASTVSGDGNSGSSTSGIQDNVDSGTEGITASRGAFVPGHGLIPGDSPKNDVVPAMLSPGEIVIPRSITQGPDAADHAAQFVAALKQQAPKQGYAQGGDVSGGPLQSAVSLTPLSGQPSVAPQSPFQGSTVDPNAITAQQFSGAPQLTPRQTDTTDSAWAKAQQEQEAATPGLNGVGSAIIGAVPFVGPIANVINQGTAAGHFHGGLITALRGMGY